MNDIKESFPFFKNNKEYIYLDSASTSQKPIDVISCISEYYSKYNSNIDRGEYYFSSLCEREYYDIKRKIGKYFSIDSSNVLFTYGATDSLNIIIDTLIAKNAKDMGNVLISYYEHNSLYVPLLNACKNKGYEIRYYSEDDNYKSLQALIDENTICVFCNIASNICTYVQDINLISKICKEKSVEFVLDASQIVPHKKIDLSDIKFDYLCFSAHKMYGPLGVGTLICTNESKKNITYRLGSGIVENINENGFDYKENAYLTEAGTQNIINIIAFGKTIDFMTSLDFNVIEKQEKELYIKAKDQISNLGYNVILKDKEYGTPILTFNHEKLSSYDISKYLAANKICVRAGKMCSNLIFNHLNEKEGVRVSIGMYNNENDIDTLVDKLKTLSKFI